MDLEYGVKEGRAVHISEVDSGLRCASSCPACGARLVAKKGQIVRHHFAHYDSNRCPSAPESGLHLAAKDAIAIAREITLPRLELQFRSNARAWVIAPETVISIEKVWLERSTSEFVPDVWVSTGGRDLFIEIVVTHGIDELKMRKLRARGVSVLEVDLSDMRSNVSPRVIHDEVVYGTGRKRWIYNAYREKIRATAIRLADRRPITRRGLAVHVDGCPIPARRWRGRPYANAIDDCATCDYCLEWRDDGRYILCLYRAGISSYNEFRAYGVGKSP